MKIPQKKELIIEMLQELTVMLIANPWGSVYKEEFKITNRYSDAILASYFVDVVASFKCPVKDYYSSFNSPISHFFADILPIILYLRPKYAIYN